MNGPVVAPAVPAKPKRRFWRWVLIIFSVIGILAVIGLISLIIMLAGSAKNVGLGQKASVRTAVMGLSAGAPMMAAYDSAESAGGSGASYSYASKGGGMMDNYAPPEPYYPNGGQTAAEVDQKIIKNGSLQLVVASVTDAAAKITAATTAKGGYVQNSSSSERSDGRHNGNITVRIPSKDFESLMSEIKALALSVKNETASGQDVTEQYTDLEAQLRNAMAQETTYLAVLDKAKTVEDILKVQQYLGQVRGTIESLQGRLKYLENVTSYSTVNIYLEEEPTIQVPTKEFRPMTELKSAVRALVDSFQKLSVSLIWAVVLGGGLLLPFALLALIVVLIVKLAKRKKK